MSLKHRIKRLEIQFEPDEPYEPTLIYVSAVSGRIDADYTEELWLCTVAGDPVSGAQGMSLSRESDETEAAFIARCEAAGEVMRQKVKEVRQA